MSVQKPQTGGRSRRDAAYAMDVVTLDAGRTSYLSAEEAARLDLDRAPRLEAHPETPVGAPKGPSGKPPATPVGTPKSAQGAPLRTLRRATREGVVR